MRFVLDAPPRRAFSFRLDEPALSRFSAACEAYALRQLGRRFKTLEYYKNVAEGAALPNKTDTPPEQTSEGDGKNPAQ